MVKNLLFIGGTPDTVMAMGWAYNDYNIYCTDINPDAPGIVWCQKYGQGWGIADVYDYHNTLSIAENWNLDGVIAVGVDCAYTVSKVAEALGLSHIPSHITHYSSDKKMLKSALQINGIAVPQNNLLSNNWLIIKPADSRGARGVQRVRPYNKTITKAVDYAKTFSDNIMYEEYVVGDQISTESIVYQGEVLFTAMSDRDYSNVTDDKTLMIEQGGSCPSIYEGTAAGTEIKRTIQRCVSVLGINSGTVKGDIVLRYNTTPVVIELAIGRISGGLSASHYWPLGYGVNFLGAAFALACGDDPRKYLKVSRTPRYARGIYQMNGNVKSNKERGKFYLTLGANRKSTETKFNERFAGSADSTMQ